MTPKLYGKIILKYVSNALGGMEWVVKLPSANSAVY
jgi:hypothetical protein